MHVPAPKHLFRFAILLVLTAVTALAVSAQETSPTQEAPKKKLPPYALIFGTIYDAQNRPVYGVPITIHLAGKKKPKWELMSDHQGEFAQRVPAGMADYAVSAEVRIKGKKPQKLEKTVHVENEERVDISLHLTE